VRIAISKTAEDDSFLFPSPKPRMAGWIRSKRPAQLACSAAAASTGPQREKLVARRQPKSIHDFPGPLLGVVAEIDAGGGNASHRLNHCAKFSPVHA